MAVAGHGVARALRQGETTASLQERLQSALVRVSGVLAGGAIGFAVAHFSGAAPAAQAVATGATAVVGALLGPVVDKERVRTPWVWAATTAPIEAVGVLGANHPDPMIADVATTAATFASTALVLWAFCITQKRHFPGKTVLDLLGLNTEK
jgi:hypothetical protein